MENRARFLVIPDLQIPFENEKALPFVKYLKRHYRIPDENCLCVGDEVDQYFGGRYPKSPDAMHTPLSEIQETIESIQDWYKAFPKMKIATSNHGLRWLKKALEAEIPSTLMRTYQEIIQAPPGWIWRDKWVFKNLKHPFQMLHGMGYSGMNGHRTAALDAGISTVIGHLHAHAGVAHITTCGQRIWGMNTGCLIDPEAYAFAYGKDSRFKPCLGASVVLDGGRTPLWFPLGSIF